MTKKGTPPTIASAAGKKGKATIQIPHMTWPSMIRLTPFTKSVVTSVPNSPTSGGKASNVSKYEIVEKQTLTKEEDPNPFNDSPLDKKSHKTAAERDCGPALCHFHDCLIVSSAHLAWVESTMHL